MNRCILITLFLLFCISLNLDATHLRAGYIHVSGEYPTVTIKITVFLDAESTVPFGGGILSFGDGSEPIEIPVVQSIMRPDLGYNIAMAIYSVDYTYPDYGSYTINYSEPNRNAHILNIPNSVNTKFSVETRIFLRPFTNFINTPEPLVPLMFKMLYKQKNALALTSSSEQGKDIQKYNLVAPKSGPNQIISGYTFPEHLKVDSTSGLLEWDLTQEDNYISNPFSGNEYVVAVRIHQFTFFEERYHLTSITTIDFQINVFSEEDDGGIIIGGDNTNVLIEGSENIELQRTIISAEKPIVDIISNIEEGSLESSVEHESSDNTYITNVNLSITNNSNEVRAPRFVILRSKIPNGYSKDDIITVHFNEVINLLDYVTASPGNEKVLFHIYPNPSTGQFMFKGLNTLPMELTIYDHEGKELMIKKFTGETEITLTNAGLYFYSLKSNMGESVRGKLVVR